MQSVTIEIPNLSGLHARPAALFIKKAQEFSSEIKVELNGINADGKSLLDILSLGVNKGDTIILTIIGEDENEALSSLKELIESGLGE